MGKTTITFRLDSAKRETLDTIAEVTDRDRSYVLNEAIDAYLDIHQWQLEHIKKGLRQAQAGQFASEKEVRKALARWRR
jgi:predicted transcriptional regulator